ncbi:hypothetical protein [Marinobacter sp. M5B]|uniref:hypothetical protein n=1 Tax=Marinobacter sp. M5B TaxID=3141535 RepID=UPI0036D2AFA5
MISAAEIPAFCEQLYGLDWLEQFKRIENVGSKALISPLVAQCGLAEASRILPKIMVYLRQACQREPINLPNPILSRLKRPAARLNEQIRRDLVDLAELDQCFLNTVAAVDSLHMDDVLALVLFSAMRFGGCINAGKLHALMMGLRELPNRYQNHYWFELEHASGVEQIWRPDPLTLVLLVTWYTKEFHLQWASDLPLAPNPHRVIASFFRKRKVWARHGMPITRLLDTVSAKLSSDISPILADCARGVIDNRTLSPIAFRRYLTGKAPRCSFSELDQQASRKPRREQRRGFAASVKPVTGNPQSESQFWAHVRRILRTESKRAVARDRVGALLEASTRTLSPIAQLLAEWVSHLLTTENQWGNRLKPSSIGLELSSILNGLRSSIGSSECLHFLGSEWGEIYSQLLDAKESLGSQRMVQKSLAEFHRFLMEIHGANETDGVNLVVSSSARGLPQVDSNILLEPEYQAAYRYFDDQRSRSKNSDSWELATCQLIALILGFRCGLRRSEVYWLRLDDIELGSQAEILLAGKRAVALKTNAANRRSPIYLLMKPWELFVIKDWIRWKLDSGNADDSHLFSTKNPQRMLIDASDIFDPLQSVLQVITGNCHARFHHLRHSFATHSFTAWMCPNAVEPSSREWVLRQRRDILNARNGTGESKKVAKALHVMVGHATVEMSLTHYVHSAEWVMFERLHLISPHLSVIELSHLLGLTERQIQRLSKDLSLRAVSLQGVAQRKLSRITPEIDISNWCAPEHKRIQIRGRKAFREREWVLDLWSALQIYQSRGSSINDLAERFNLRPETIERSLLRAKQIFSIKYGTAGHDYYRHRPTSWAEPNPAPVIFDFPAKQKDLRSALTLVRSYEGLPKRQKRVARWAVKYFLDHGSSGRAQITFRDKTSLRKFARALEILDVQATVRSGNDVKQIPRFRLKLVMPSSVDSAERKAAWDFWLRGFSCYPFQMKDEVAAALGQMGRIELSILAFKGRSPARSDTKRINSRPGDWGVRLGLYLIAIALGWGEEGEFEHI